MIIMAAQVERADLTLPRRWKTACCCAVWNHLYYLRQYVVVVLTLISAHVTAAHAPPVSSSILDRLPGVRAHPSVLKAS